MGETRRVKLHRNSIADSFSRFLWYEHIGESGGFSSQPGLSTCDGPFIVVGEGAFGIRLLDSQHVTKDARQFVQLW